MENLSASRLENVLNQMNSGLLLLDAAGRVVSVNETFVRLSGYSAEELLGEGFYAHLFPGKDARDRIREKALGALETPFDDLEMSIVSEKGDKLSIHVLGSRIEEEGEPLVSLLIQDVTNRKAYEKVIESSFDNFIKVTMERDEALRKINEQNSILENYKAKMVRELNIAKSVQKAIIPKQFPRISHFDMFGVSVPSEELGGDYFDYFLLEENRIGLLIADVSGHGVPSSLITTMVKAYFEYYTKRYWEPDKVLQNVNRDMAAIIQDTGFYLTAYYAVLDLKTLKLTVSSAGHDSALAVTRGREDAFTLGGEGADGTILGIFPDAEYQAQTYQLEPDTKIIIYTDGITEARSDTGEFFGTERLQQFLKSQLGRSSRDSVEALIRQVDDFYGTSHPNDDRTLVIFDLLKESRRQVDLPALLSRGKAALKTKDFRSALTCFSEYLDEEPENAEASFLQGQTFSYLSLFAEACASLQKAVRLAPDHVKAHYYLGIAAHNLRDFALAKRAWKQVLELSPGYKDTAALLEKLDKKS